MLRAFISLLALDNVQLQCCEIHQHAQLCMLLWCVSEQAIMMLRLRKHKMSTCHMSTNATAALLQQQTGLLMQCVMNKAAFGGVNAKVPCRG